MEKWLPVVGFDGYYEVSNYGNVRSVTRQVERSDGVIQTRFGKNKRLYLNRDGYLTVKLSKDGFDRRYFVHRLVAEAFLTNTENLAEVDHINDDRADNRVENLRWVSRFDNVRKVFDQHHHYTQTHNIFGKNNPNYSNDTLSNFYKENKDIALLKQGRPGAQNGKAKAVKMYDPQFNLVKEYPYIRACADDISKTDKRHADAKCIAARIGMVANTPKLYKGHYFVTE